jgi:cation diffusion facilitator family transporter
MKRVSQESTDAFSAGERIAKLSVLTLLSIGIVQIPIGLWTGSVGLTADGVTSISDSLISMIVWVGLHFSRRRPDARFHFGYHKVESLSALILSIGMVAIGSYIFYHSYQTFLKPETISYPLLALVVLFFAGLISLYRAYQMRGVANKYGLLSLRTDAYNSIKDASSSFVVFVAVLSATVLGVRELDAVAGMIIAIYIFAVAYVAIRESTLTLLDACESPEMTHELTRALETVDEVRAISSIRLRPSGPYMTGIISVQVDDSITVAKTEQIRKKLLEIIRTIVEPMGEVTVVFRAEPHS